MVNLKQYFVHKKSTYQYQITASNYNPTIDSEVDITVKVMDYAGDIVANKSVTLYKDGTSVSSSTTNSSGMATWTITFSDWDVHHFNVENATLDLRADGWKQIAVSTGNLWVNERNKLAMYTFTRAGAITSEISYANIIPSQYRPKSQVRMLGHNSNNMIRIGIDTAGTVRISGGTSSSSITVAAQLTYAFGV